MNKPNSKQSLRPSYLYKYLHPDRIDVLENKTIRYSQLDDMNDPFDSNPYFHNELIRHAGDQAVYNHQHSYISSFNLEPDSPEYIEAWDGMYDYDANTGWSDHVRSWANNQEQSKHNLYMRKVMGGYLGALCLTSNPTNQLMWSHYANNHTGFIIKFKAGKKGLAFRGKRKSPIGYLSQVNYLEERPVFFDNNFSLDEFLLSKSPWWEYENEWRIVKRLKSAKKIIKRKDDYPICLFELPAHCIESIIVGCMASKELVGKLIMLFHKNEEYHHISLKGCKMDGYHYDLEIDHLFNSVNYWKKIHIEQGEKRREELFAIALSKLNLG